MSEMRTVYPVVRAVYRAGILQLLDPLTLPDGAEVRVRVESSSQPRHISQELLGLYPNNPQPASTLHALQGVVAVGGNALADSEALYEPDW
jgi:predicted DNA-binding antitoxin AbrB/MazE fold protein